MKTVADIFCGIGGFSEGLKQAGYDIKFGLDIDRDCIETFELNNKESLTFTGGIHKFKESPFDVDLVIGSPPCPTFSMASRKRGNDLELTNEFFRVMKLFKPKMWLMENVPPILQFFPEGKLLNACDYGVPQNRKRCFVSNAFFNPIQKEMRCIKDGIDVKDDTFIVDSRVAHFSDDKVIFPIDGIAPTLTTKCNGLHVVESYDGFRNFYARNVAESIKEFLERKKLNNFFKVRRVTIKECLKLQGFPDDYEMSYMKSKDKPYELIGNAVPPPLSKSIGKSLRPRKSLMEVFG